MCIPQSRASSKVVGMRPHRAGRIHRPRERGRHTSTEPRFRRWRGSQGACLLLPTTSTVLQLVRGVKPHARHPIVHLFTPLLLPLEGYWESGTLGPTTAKPNARCTLCTPSLGHLVHRVSAAVGLLIATTEMVERSSIGTAGLWRPGRPIVALLGDSRPSSRCMS
jgi:hypothetical protein